MKYEVNINQRSFNFAVQVINFCRTLPRDQIYKILVSQVIRSVTSIGANLEEAAGAHTRSSFINCTNISKKEARETYYWLKLIYEISDRATKDRMAGILKEADEIIRILTVSVKRLQENTRDIQLHNSNFRLKNSKGGR